MTIEHNMGYDRFWDECRDIILAEIDRLVASGENDTLKVALSVLYNRCSLLDNIELCLDEWYWEYLSRVRHRALENEKTTFKRD